MNREMYRAHERIEGEKCPVETLDVQRKRGLVQDACMHVCARIRVNYIIFEAVLSLGQLPQWLSESLPFQLLRA